jgi:hypothetical protein
MSKSTKPSIRIHNIETDEIIDREMTDAEFSNYQELKKIENEKQSEIETKAAARQAILDRLGLTADEAKLLLG